jgi:flagellum-specific peptidoglycan hydrolase FlgJ
MIKKGFIVLCLLALVSCKSGGLTIFGKKKSASASSGSIIRTTKTPVLNGSNAAKKETTKEVKTVTLEATTKVQVTTALVQEYIQKYKDIAKEDMLKYGIPASITLGQGILESGAGTGPLSMQANNHFGIKCHKEWTGDSIKYDDDEAAECFRKYNNPEESYRDHSLFLTSRPRYASLFQLPINDYKSWAKGLKDAGYATDPNYPTKLYLLIERYNLQQYDNEVLGIERTTQDPVKPVEKTTNPVVEQPKSVPAPVQSSVVTNAKTHVVVKGDTLYSLSKKYGISIDELKQKNALLENSISIGQELIIQ